MRAADLLIEAQCDFDESFDWYSQRSTEAAARFVLAVDVALADIALHPERFAAVDERHRACRVERFPFRVIYRVESQRVLVVAIAHAKRRPGYWTGRK